MLRALLLLTILVGVTTYVFTHPAIPQSLEYHNFADKRRLFGIPNFFDVASNGLFFFGGIAGVHTMMWESNRAFKTKTDEIPWWLLFVSGSCVAVGSSYYHWEPTTYTLFWDRLPMTITFMSTVSALITERVNSDIGRRSVVPLQFIGVGSVVYWLATELYSVGDLRPYIVVQAAPVLMTPIMFALYDSAYTHSHYMLYTVTCYVIAKITEHYDAAIFKATDEFVSGHTLKHVIAGIGFFFLSEMIRVRRIKQKAE